MHSIIISQNQSLFRPAKNLLSLTEKRETLGQSLIFLQRCRQQGIIPRFIEQAIKLPEDFRPSRLLFKLLDKTGRSLLTHAIRAKWSSMANLKRQITNVRSSLPDQVLNKLDPILAQARTDRKRECKTSLTRKFDHLYDRQKGRHGKTKDINLPRTNERISAIGDIDVPTAASNIYLLLTDDDAVHRNVSIRYIQDHWSLWSPAGVLWQT